MLINTVLLFLQNALPIFIITALLLLRFSSKTINNINVKWLVLSFLLVIIFAFILSSFLENISQLADGKGIELFLSSGLILVYFSSIGLFVLKNTQADIVIKIPLAFIIFFVISCFNGALFIVYLTSYWAKAQQVETMFMGIILGGGICLSIAILFYFLLKFTDQNIHPNTSNYFLLFFTIGQLMHAIALLQQVDILPSSQSLWNSGNFIAENSELGQLLTVLFGYETTPSTLQFITYVIAFIIPVIISHSTTLRSLLRGERA
mgnify:CR=1 FL=1